MNYGMIYIYIHIFSINELLINKILNCILLVNIDKGRGVCEYLP
jgi:hypothetical protein